MKHTEKNYFEEKVFSYMKEYQMLLPGERVVAGISGGADSVCLLFVLLEWQRRYGLELAVVHINHGIRAEAGEDARFVENLCSQRGIPFYLRETDVRGLAEQESCSEEEAGRNFRYRVFAETAEELGAGKIAVAHNLNDCGETMLFHLFRGSGIKGLTGIAPVRDRIIRPLLCVERREIEDYLAAIGQEYCRDATNEGDAYTRNRIRHHILPYVEREIVSGCVQHMGQTAETLRETEDYLEQQTAAALGQCAERMQDGWILDCGAFAELHPAIQKRILHVLLKELAPDAKDISRVHVLDLHELSTVEGNRRICLPFGICGQREYGKVFLSRGQQENKAGETGEVRMDFQVFSVEDLPKDAQNSPIFPQNLYTKWFDYDKIKRLPVVRTRTAGDYLMIRDGQGNLCHKKLKDYMVTEKIPSGMRDRIPVLAEDSHVLWLVGYRISEYYKVSGNTNKVLQVQLISGCEDSNTEEKNGRAY